MLLTAKCANVTADKTGVKAGGSATGMENSLDFAPSLDDAINNLERMLNKIFAFCNNQNEQLSGQTPNNLFHENDEIKINDVKVLSSQRMVDIKANYCDPKDSSFCSI